MSLGIASVAGSGARVNPSSVKFGMTQGKDLTDSSELQAEVTRWELEPSEIIVGELLGKGAFGVVFKGKLHEK